MKTWCKSKINANQKIVEMAKSVKQSTKKKELANLKNSQNFKCLVKTKIYQEKPAERKFSEIMLIIYLFRTNISSKKMK